jgi:integrase
MLKKRKGSSYFWYKFRFNGRVYEASTKMTNAAAAGAVERAARLRLAQEAAGTVPLVPVEAAPVFEAAAALWLDGYKVAAERSGLTYRRSGAWNTLSYYENALKQLAPAFAGRRLDQITPAEVRAYQSRRMGEVCVRGGRRGKPVSNRTINIELVALRGIFEHAIRSERWPLLVNPVSKVKRLKEDKKMRVPSGAELARYFAALAVSKFPDGLDIGKVIALQGCRPHEVMGLRVSDVDFAANLLRIAHQERGAAVAVAGKTANSARELYMRAEVRAILERRAAEAGADRGAWLFPSRLRAGQPVHSFQKAHHTAARKAGIAGFTVYDLRHYFATDTLARGVDIGTVSKILGHSDISTTNRYVHPMAQAMRAAMIHLDGGQDAGQAAGASEGGASAAPVVEAPAPAVEAPTVSELASLASEPASITEAA